METKKKCWEPRQRGTAIGRIPYCTPTCGERFYLRLLLTVVSGAKSFEDLRTVNDIEYPTFKEACLVLHLIEDDREWSHCFREAYLFSSGSSLRDLFITALTYGQLVDPLSLWLEFRDSICDDLDHKLRQLIPDNDFDATANESDFYYGSPIFDYGLLSTG
jgi:hypothetical protein